MDKSPTFNVLDFILNGLCKQKLNSSLQSKLSLTDNADVVTYERVIKLATVFNDKSEPR